MSYEPYLIGEEEETIGRGEEHHVLPLSPFGDRPFFLSHRLPAKPSEWRLSEEPLNIFLGSIHDKALFFYDVTPAEIAQRSIQFQHILASVLSAPPSTQALDALIENARLSILALKGDWDDAGGQPYRASTIDRAADLLKRLAALMLIRRFELPSPAIRPADAGSVDLYWADVNRTLLINVPEDTHVPATFSGRRGNVDTVAGTIDLNEGLVSHLASWLTE